MELKRLKIQQITKDEYDSLPDILGISEPFLTILMRCDKLINNPRFRVFLMKELGCSYAKAINPILDKTEYMVIRRHNHMWNTIHKVKDEKTGKVIGYAIPPFKELEIALRNWKALTIKIKDMNKEENISPINFEQSNIVLKGRDKADDLPAFNDGKTIVSCWRPTFWGAIKILITRKIWLGVLGGNTQPPVWLTANNPFIK